MTLNQESQFEKIIPVDSIKIESYTLVRHHLAEILLFRTSSGIQCLENRCPHAGKSLNGGTYSNSKITCPVHGATFSIVDGSPLCPPAVRPVKTYPVRVVDGYIEVDFEAR